MTHDRAEGRVDDGTADQSGVRSALRGRGQPDAGSRWSRCRESCSSTPGAHRWSPRRRWHCRVSCCSAREPPRRTRSAISASTTRTTCPAAGSVTDRAVVDFAEIPTRQADASVDADGDGATSNVELQRFGEMTCESVRGAATLRLDSAAMPFTMVSARSCTNLARPACATSRLECVSRRAVDLSRSTRSRSMTRFESDRVGWHEITAIGDGVRLIDSPVPEVSGTGTLRNYPTDLLASPLDVRNVEMSLAPATGGYRHPLASRTGASRGHRCSGAGCSPTWSTGSP